MTSTSEMRAKRREHVREYKVSQGCQDCGITHIAVLDFHHKDNDRNGGPVVGKLISETASWKRVLEEIERCIVLCANCHRMRHYMGD